MLDRDGRVYGTRTKAHPLLEHVQKLSTSVLANLEAMQVTQKARGEGRRESEIANMLERRRAMLPGADKSLMPPPVEDEEPIESEVVT